MVIWFSIFWYVIYVFSYIFENKNRLIWVFRKVFPYAVLPQLFMLFYAIGLRINQYDITVNRYFVVVFWLFLLFTSLYYIFSKEKRIHFLPFTLTLISVFISVWPWSVYSYPAERQLDRLQDNLIEAWILKDWNIIPLEQYEDIDKKLSKNIYSWISYVCDFSDCEDIKKLFPNEYRDLEIKHKKQYKLNKNDSPDLVYDTPYKWEVVRAITEAIKVKEYFELADENEPQINLYLDRFDKIFPLDVDWYSAVLRIESRYTKDLSYYAKLNAKNKTIEIVRSENTTDSIDISNMVDELYETYKSSWKQDIDIQKMTFEVSDYRVIFEHISIENPDYIGENDDVDFYGNWYLLVR